jgi:hypothetical protein
MYQKEIPPSVSVFPNPSLDYFRLELGGFDGGTWSLQSANGIIMEESAITQINYSTTVDVRTFPRGLYLLKVQKDQSVITRKIIISPLQGK